MDYRILNAHTDVNARNCTRGFTDTVREFALKKWLWEKNLLLATGNRTCVSGVPVRCSNHLSYIPTPVVI